MPMNQLFTPLEVCYLKVKLIQLYTEPNFGQLGQLTCRADEGIDRKTGLSCAPL